MIFSTETCALLHHEECGAVSVVEMLFRTSLVALVGHSARGGSSGRQLTMWNTKERKKICHLCFEALIYGVRMSHRRVVVLMREQAHILDLKTMKRLHAIDRSPSPWLDPSIAALCHDSNRGYLALPMGLTGGHPAATFAVGPNASAVTAPNTTAQGDVARAEVKIGLVSMVDTYTLQPVGVLLAHRSPVQALALSPTGHMLATASSKASVIRVFSVPAFETLCVYRRGSSPCRIFGLNFSRNSQFLSAAVASGTVHIFKNSDQMLANLLPANSMSSLGIAQETKVSCSPSDSRPVVKPGPEAEIDEADSTEDLSEWNVVEERPERALEFWNAALPDNVGNQCLKRDALQALSEASENAVGNVAKHARSIFQLLPQSCRDLVDAERAFAVVRLREEESPLASAKPSPKSSPQLGPAKAPYIADSLPGVSLSSVLGALPGVSSTGGMAYGYVACVNSKLNGVGSGRLEVLVATRRGCAYVYDWGSTTGGEGRLRAEHSIAPMSLEDVPKTPRVTNRDIPGNVTPAKLESTTPAARDENAGKQVQTLVDMVDLAQAQLGA